ncbi:SAM-dependent methyltransferase [Stygiolobus rod-shaped virus]|uniref:Methyltransferase n=1 Tax=Stygiolobus rod-shaped virus TaxID=537009 RepID=B6EFD6_9VIRU|nr:SAM-dependent methyltransferase [Stygiolobus rod-shaped virus]CAQ58471.1 hypothetical protein [Stygiolobus rod-shaped virus]
MNYVEYFSNLKCQYFHEYQYSYSKLNVKDKTITIIGNDCGSSALYFLIRNAKYIIGYEKDENLNKLFKEKVCKDFNICDKVEVHGEWKGDEYPNTNIFIIDCEGCEEKLDVSKLEKYEQYCIAIHDWTKNRVELMRKLYGLTFTYISDDGREIVLCKIR